jgi:hypothetical protein
MQKLINDLLIFSRPADSLDSFVEVDLNELIGEVLSDMEVEIDKHGVKVRVDVLPKVWGIPSQIRQLFQNLISNGIKFRKEGQCPEITIYNEVKSTPLLDRFNLSHRIVVQDNGIGFDEKYVDEIFVVFKRLHSYHEYEGTGVGLSICKKIAERHNGKISAQSKINEGSKFIMELPVITRSEKLPSLTVNEVSIKE